MKLRKTILLLLLVLLLTACTSRKNLTGFENSTLHPQQVVLAESLFTNTFSYQDSTHISGESTKLSIGTYEGAQAKALLKFYLMPSTIYEIVGQPQLKLTSAKKLATGAMVLHIDKVLQNWSESQANWTNAYTDTTWSSTAFQNVSIPDFTTPATIATTGDTLKIPIPSDVVKNWSHNRVSDFNLLLSSVSNGILEVKSSETSYGPILSFYYKKTATDTTTYHYEAEAILDSWITNLPNQQTAQNGFWMKNIAPGRLFLQFDIPRSSFVYSDDSTTVVSAEDMKRMTINKAELLIKVKTNPTYLSSEKLSVTAYRVKKEIAQAGFIANTDLEYLTYTPISSDTLGGTWFSINVTPFVQAVVSQKFTNQGLVIRSTAENYDFSKVEFFDHNTSNPADRPYLKLKYTTPYIVTH